VLGLGNLPQKKKTTGGPDPLLEHLQQNKIMIGHLQIGDIEMCRSLGCLLQLIYE
jgi:hypothetical protein